MQEISEHPDPRPRRRFLARVPVLLAAAIAAGSIGFAAEESPSPPAPVRIALFSDTHIPVDSEESYKGFHMTDNLRTAVGQMIQYAPEAAVLCGDAGRLQGKEGDYKALHKLLEPLMKKCPVAVAMGNHDNRANFHKVFPGSQPGAAKVPGHDVMVLEWPVVRLVVLDSLQSTNHTPGLLGKAQLAWLEKFLEEGDARPTVLFMHHPPGGGKNGLNDSDLLLRLIKRYPQVKALVFGHTHAWTRRTLDGLQLINLPALGYNFNKQQPVGWVAASFRPDGVDLTLHAIGGNRKEDGKTTSIEWKR